MDIRIKKPKYASVSDLAKIYGLTWHGMDYVIRIHMKLNPTKLIHPGKKERATYILSSDQIYLIKQYFKAKEAGELDDDVLELSKFYSKRIKKAERKGKKI